MSPLVNDTELFVVRVEDDPMVEAARARGAAFGIREWERSRDYDPNGSCTDPTSFQCDAERAEQALAPIRGPYLTDEEILAFIEAAQAAWREACEPDRGRQVSPHPTEWNAWGYPCHLRAEDAEGDGDDSMPDPEDEEPMWLGSAPTEREAARLLPTVRGYPRGQLQKGIGGEVVNY